MARNFYNYVNYSYDGGMNDTDRPEELKANEAQLIKNAYIDTRGALIKRKGISQLGDDTGDTRITGEVGWIEDDNTKWHLRTTGTELQYLNSTTWDTIDNGFTSDLDTEFVAANNKIYILNGTDNIHSWDGATVALNSGLTDLGGSVPTAKYGVWWKNYMFICGSATLSGTTYPSRVYFSNLGDPDTWTTGTDYFDVNKSDGQPIVGIKPLGDFLVIFKRRSTYVMTGDSPSDWRISSSVNNLQVLESNIGCTSHRSIVQVGNDLWFWTDAGLRSLKRNEQATLPLMGEVAGKIQGTITNLNAGAFDKVCGVLHDNRVYYAVANGSSSYNNLVLVADTKIQLDDQFNPHPWVQYTGWNVGCWCVHTPNFQPVLYYGEASADSLSFQAETGTNDDSAGIDYDYQSGAIDLDQPHMKKTSRFIMVSGNSSGNYSVDVSSSDDGVIWTQYGSLDLLTGTAWNSAVWDTDTWGYGSKVTDKIKLARAGRQIFIRFQNDNADEPVTMYPYTIAIKTKKIK